ncbi:MAG: diguanylate cyclase domain-containing protein [Acidimicrobiales bacterium]
MGDHPLPQSTYRTIVETAISPFLTLAREGTITWASESIRELLGHDPDSLVGSHALDLIHPDSHGATLEALERIGELTPDREAGWTSSGLVVDLMASDGRRVSCDVSVATPARTQLDSFVIQLRRAVGASALQQTMAAMAAGESCETVLSVVAEMFAQGLANTTIEILYEWEGGRFRRQVGSPDTVIELDHTTGDEPWIRAARTGRSELIEPIDTLHPPTKGAVQQHRLVGGVAQPVQIDLMDRPAAVVVAWWGSLSRSPIFEYRVNQAVDLVGLILQWHQGRRALEWEASHDALTTLTNRRAFVEGVEHRMTDGIAGSVFYLDLDEFKAVNDEHGHLIGDEMLAAAAERVQACTRPGDLVARLGGDEFAVFCPHLVDPDAAYELANRFVAALSRPFAVEGVTATIGASVGIALSDDDTTLDQILAAADSRLLEAKSAGKNQVRGPVGSAG